MLAIFAEGQGGYQICVPWQGEQLLTGLRIPNFNRRNARSRQQRPVRAEQNSPNRAVMPGQFKEFLPGSYIPDNRCCIPTAGCNQVTIRAESSIIDWILMSF